MLLVRKLNIPVCVLMSYIDILSSQESVSTSNQGALSEDLRPISRPHTQIHIQSVCLSVS